MSKHMPTIAEYMTTSPHSIGVEQTLARARTMMQEHKIRHLPVLHGGKVVGLVSDRDVRFVESLKDTNPQIVRVSEAMTEDVYSVAPAAPLNEVAAEMASRKYGSAVVMEEGKVVGIFTTVDACRAVAMLLESRVEG
jgi:acetoin utilization protein AcuB